MQSSVLPTDVLYFHCENCGAELSVPIALHGVEGPCPTCGDRIKAPELYIPEPESQSQDTLVLPPADGQHDAAPWRDNTSPVPSWMNRQGATVPVQAAPSALPVAVMRPLAPVNDLLPKQLSGSEHREFKARLSIPGSEAGLDDSWVDRHRSQQQRQMVKKKLDRAANHFLESTFFRVARVALLVITGGLCAGLVLYLKDRKWMLNMPWSQTGEQSLVDTPSGTPQTPSAPGARMPENPFLVEDSSELERTPASAPLTPLPDPVSVPVGASPVVSGKN